jgi:hypothetical protein
MKIIVATRMGLTSVFVRTGNPVMEQEKEEGAVKEI